MVNRKPNAVRQMLTGFYRGFAQDRFELFKDFANQLTAEKYLSSWAFPIVLTIVSVLNFQRFGLAAGLSYSLPILVFLAFHLPFLKLRTWMSYRSTSLMAINASLIFAGVVFVVHLGGEVTLKNTPLQIVLVVMTLVVRLPRLRDTQIFLNANVLIGFSALFILHPEWISDLIIQPITVIPIVTLLARAAHDEWAAAFYEREVNSRKILQLFNQLKKKVYTHQMSQIESGAELEATMPVGQSQGCSLKFDVVNSSEIVHQEFQSFLRRFDNRCKAILMEHYKAEPLQSAGYRLKGTGDGLITVHGFPFAAPEGYSPATIALEVAEKFAAAFDEEMNTLDYPEAILCSIGIGMGDLAGYHTTSGVVEYDMTGRAIVMAERYETLRKELFPAGTPGEHVITIPEKVYKNLNASQREAFEEFKLDDLKVSVRNDRSAKRAYVRRLKCNQVSAKKDSDLLRNRRSAA